MAHVDVLRELINRANEALKPKTAFLVIRTELPPGLETQLDYWEIGTQLDAASRVARNV